MPNLGQDRLRPSPPLPPKSGGRASGPHWFAQTPAGGVALARALMRRACREPDALGEALAHGASALAYVHAHGTAHCDVKPANMCAPPPPSRTNWTRLVPPPVLIGYVIGHGRQMCACPLSRTRTVVRRRRWDGAARRRRRV